MPNMYQFDYPLRFLIYKNPCIHMISQFTMYENLLLMRDRESSYLLEEPQKLEEFEE